MNSKNKIDLSDSCEICKAKTVKLHCKIICHNCGFMRDCSDP